MTTLIAAGIVLAGGIVSLAIWRLRNEDRTVIDRMGSSKRVDGKDDPHAHTPHSHI